MNNRFYVYGHYTLDTNELFYIGKGTGYRARSKRRRNIYWTNIVNKHGFTSKLLLTNLNEEEAFYQEYLATKEAKPRANLVDGGQGLTSEIAKNLWTKPEFREKMARSQAESWKDGTRSVKTSNMLKKRWADAETSKVLRESISKSLTGIKLLPEHAKKARLALEVARTLIDHSLRIKRLKEVNNSRVYLKLSDEHKRKLNRKNKKHSAQSNLKRAISMGSKPFLVFTKGSMELVGEWTNASQCAKDLSLDNSCIGKCLSGNENRTAHKGYVFKYKESI